VQQGAEGTDAAEYGAREEQWETPSSRSTLHNEIVHLYQYYVLDTANNSILPVQYSCRHFGSTIFQMTVLFFCPLKSADCVYNFHRNILLA
jgi:hypothetical protein